MNNRSSGIVNWKLLGLKYDNEQLVADKKSMMHSGVTQHPHNRVFVLYTLLYIEILGPTLQFIFLV